MIPRDGKKGLAVAQRRCELEKPACLPAVFPSLKKKEAIAVITSIPSSALDCRQKDQANTAFAL